MGQQGTEGGQPRQAKSVVGTVALPQSRTPSEAQWADAGVPPLGRRGPGEEDTEGAEAEMAVPAASQVEVGTQGMATGSG